MADGPPERPDEPVDEPLGALPAATRPPSDGSGWGINWWGFVPLAIVAALAFAGFRAVGFGGDDDAAGAAPPSTRVGPTITQRPRPTTTTSTSSTTTTVAAVPTRPPTTVPAGPSVVAWGEIKPCRFGDACLIVSFTASGFDPPQMSFSCIYPNSTRQFSFDGTGELEACLTGDEGDTVIIEVGGVQSAPVSASNLQPAGAPAP